MHFIWGNERPCINNQPLIKHPEFKLDIRAVKESPADFLNYFDPYASIKSQFSALAGQILIFSLRFIGIWFAKIKLKPLILLFPRVPSNKLARTGLYVLLLQTSPKVSECVGIWWHDFVLYSNISCQDRTPIETVAEVWDADRNHSGNHFHSSRREPNTMSLKHLETTYRIY